MLCIALVALLLKIVRHNRCAQKMMCQGLLLQKPCQISTPIIIMITDVKRSQLLIASNCSRGIDPGNVIVIDTIRIFFRIFDHEVCAQPTKYFISFFSDIFSSQRSCRALRMLIDLRLCVCVSRWILKRKKELRDLKIAKIFFDQ